VDGGGAGHEPSVPTPLPDDLEPPPDDLDPDHVDPDHVDPDARATITPYRDGPLIVRGDVRLVDQDGVEIDPGRRTIALCRCGQSAIKPFCDGTHKRSGFMAPSAPRRPRPASSLRAAENFLDNDADR
jgi:CDGSH-type Zn-finger protein